MGSCFTSGDFQVSTLAVATIGWILAIASMGGADWRVWYLEEDNAPVISHGIAWVGFWKVCFYSTVLPSPHARSDKICHAYNTYDAFIPQDFRAVQNIFLVACILGALGKVSIIVALRTFYMGDVHKTTCNPFTLGGFFYTMAGICIIICVTWNYYAVLRNKSINFPSTFSVPSSPRTQEIGTAVPVAILSAVLLLQAGVLFLFPKFRVDCQVHPLPLDSGDQLLKYEL
ncbi:claudin-34 [Trichosurus vulpecula]|uniref:claudin-34 n=1 Tax=Trichosurus vulpecula TaxID=9337 RepID=UPI00186AF899|nr:claudin-34 [Trichosurus vulpecula]